MLHALVMLDREANGEEPSPTLVIADAQSTKSGPNQGGSGLLVSSYDGGKKVKGYKRHIVTDKDGRFLEGIVTPADANDRYVLAWAIAYMKPLYPFMKIVLGDSGYSGQDYTVEFKDRTIVSVAKKCTEKLASLFDAPEETRIAVAEPSIPKPNKPRPPSPLHASPPNTQVQTSTPPSGERPNCRF